MKILNIDNWYVNKNYIKIICSIISNILIKTKDNITIISKLWTTKNISDFIKSIIFKYVYQIILVSTWCYVIHSIHKWFE